LLQLVQRIWIVPLLHNLSFGEVKDVIQNSMYKQRFSPGDIVLSSEASTGGIYFILSGSVRVEVHEREGRGPVAIPSASSSRAGSKSASGRREFAPPDSFLASPSQLGRIRPGYNRSTLNASSKPRWSVSRILNSFNIGVNQIFGDLGLFSGSHVTTVVVALEETKVLCLPCEEVGHLMMDNQSVQNAVLDNAIDNLHRAAISCSSSMRHNCQIVQFMPGDLIFDGGVDALTPVMYVVIGSVEVKDDESGEQTIFHVNHILCGEHLFEEDRGPYSAKALVSTVVLLIYREDLSMMTRACPEKKPVAPLPGTLIIPEYFNAFERKISTCSSMDELTPVGKFTPRCHNDGVETICIEEPAAEPLPAESSTSQVIRVTPKAKPRHSSRSNASQTAPSLKVTLAELSGKLGWDHQVDIDPDDMQKYEDDCNADTLTHLVTDQELEEHKEEVREAVADMLRRKKGRRQNTKSSNDRRNSKNFDGSMSMLRQLSPMSNGHGNKSADIAENEVTPMDGADNQDNSDMDSDDGDRVICGCPTNALEEDPGPEMAPLVIWIGILLESIPESFIIGILVNKSVGTPGGLMGGVMPFISGVFLSNIPESMGSAGSMKAHGMKTSTIMLLWLAISLLTAITAAIGAACFPSGTGQVGTDAVVASVEGIAAGAMLTMIAQSMMPEAFAQGGDIIGLSCLAGFLIASCMRMLPR